MTIVMSERQARQQGLMSAKGEKRKKRSTPPNKRSQEEMFFHQEGCYILARRLGATEFFVEPNKTKIDLLGSIYTPDAQFVTTEPVWCRYWVEVKGPIDYVDANGKRKLLPKPSVSRSLTCLKQLVNKLNSDTERGILAECTIKRGRASWRFWLVPAEGNRKELK